MPAFYDNCSTMTKWEMLLLKSIKRNQFCELFYARPDKERKVSGRLFLPGVGFGAPMQFSLPWTQVLWREK